MKKRTENAQQGYNLALTAIALLETPAQRLIHFAMAPFLRAAKEYVHGALARVPECIE